jgi:hypothetical protein
VRVDLYRILTDRSPELDEWREDPPREVFVNGERVMWCVAFDIDAGMAWYVSKDIHGRTRIGPDGNALIARIVGDVTVLRESEP